MSDTEQGFRIIRARYYGNDQWPIPHIVIDIQWDGEEQKRFTVDNPDDVNVIMQDAYRRLHDGEVESASAALIAATTEAECLYDTRYQAVH